MKANDFSGFSWCNAKNLRLTGNKVLLAEQAGHTYVHAQVQPCAANGLSIQTCMMHVIPYQQNDPILELGMKQGTAEDAVEVLH